MGLLGKRVKGNVPARYYDPETVELLDARGETGRLVRNTYFDRIEIRAQSVKAVEATLSLGATERQAAGEFLRLVKELKSLERETDDSLIRSLMEQYNEQAIHRTANTFDKTIRIAAQNQAEIVFRPVDREK